MIRSAILLVSVLAFSAGLSATPSQGDTDNLLKAYFAVHRGLAEDNLAAAQSAAGSLGKEADAPAEVAAAANALAGAVDITTARVEFQSLSNALQTLLDSSGTEGAPVYVARCPMAFGGEGGTWLQDDKAIANPYLGTKMSRCGSVIKEIDSDSASTDTDGHSHQ